MEPWLSVTAALPGWPFKPCVCLVSSLCSGLDSSGTANAAAVSEEGAVDGEAAGQVEPLSFNTDSRTSVLSAGGGGGGGGVSRGSSVSVGGTKSLLAKAKCVDLLLFAAAPPAGPPPLTSSLAELFSILDDLPLGRRMVFFNKVEVFLALRSCPVFCFPVLSKASASVLVLPENNPPPPRQHLSLVTIKTIAAQMTRRELLWLPLVTLD